MAPSPIHAIRSSIDRVVNALHRPRSENADPSTPASPQQTTTPTIDDKMAQRGHQRTQSGLIPSMIAASHELKSNTLIVVLGASGDLAKKKTFPAIFNLFREELLPKDLHIVGYARTKMEPEEFRKREVQYFKGADDPEIQKKIEAFQSISTYVAGSYDKDEDYQVLEKHLQEIESQYPTEDRNRIFYFALPPTVFTSVAEHLHKNNYTEKGVNRIIVEKPFGKDLESSRIMMAGLKAVWSEDETFRIDHYLGKEMVKNILVLRFANIALSAGWNNHFISNVQITFKEPFGTEGRGGYFDEFGIIRDVQQNHLLQVLTILTMERPLSFAAEDIRDEKVKVLRAIPPIEPDDVLLGQYVGANGKPGYLEDDTVPKGSNCPTFAAVALRINSPRWEGVPFILKAGKALNEAKVEVRIQYKDVTQGIFKDIARDELVIRIQPNEAVYIKTNMKTPGFQTRAFPAEMDLTYKRRFSEAKIPEAYEALILDCFKGDHSNFVRDDELDAAWKIFTPILHWIEGKQGNPPKPIPYPYGSRGPKELEAFVEKHGYRRRDDAYVWPVTDIAKI